MSFGCSPLRGCTDPTACNYKDWAEIDDGSCTSAFDLYGINTDCNGNCLPGFELDACNVCGGVNTCCPSLGDVYDCNMDCNGSAFIDDCGVCSGGNSGHVANSDKDCFGNCFGLGFVDDCGVCVYDGNETPFYCCNDHFVCGTSICFPDAPSLSPTGLDSCNVCLGDDTDCNGSILIHDWDIFPSYGFWSFGLGQNDHQYLNCDADPPCFDNNIDQDGTTKLKLKLNVSGEGFDLNADMDPDYDINITYRLYINRVVGLSSGAISNCHDIIDTTVTTVFNANNAVNGIQEDIYEISELFSNVTIDGNDIELNNSMTFDATYHMQVYIESFNIPYFEFPVEQIIVNDIDNKIEADFTIHHSPIHVPCPNVMGDANTDGVVNCSDLFTAVNLEASGQCSNYENNDAAPAGCCTIAMLRTPSDVLNQSDIDYLMQMLLQEGNDCSPVGGGA